MGRSGYTDDDYDHWQHIMWRGAVASSIKGRRGQAFLKEMLASLDALPEKRLIKDALQDDYQADAVCAIGAVGRARGIDMAEVDPDDNEAVAGLFGISHALACEIMFMNDDAWWRLSPEDRYMKMREWVVDHLKPEAS